MLVDLVVVSGESLVRGGSKTVLERTPQRLQQR